MSSLCLDELGNLLLKLDNIEDPSTRNYLDEWFELAGYQNMVDGLIFPKTKDEVKFIRIAKETEQLFEDQNEKMRALTAVSKSFSFVVPDLSETWKNQIQDLDGLYSTATCQYGILGRSPWIRKAPWIVFRSSRRWDARNCHWSPKDR